MAEGEETKIGVGSGNNVESVETVKQPEQSEQKPEQQPEQQKEQQKVQGVQTAQTVERSIAERKQKFASFFKGKGYNWVFFVLLIALIIVVIFVRTANVPYLQDETTGEYTLGPDLDPFLFLRYAKTIVEQGSLPEIDTMRNVPLGFNTGTETRLLPYTIVYLYRFLHFFNPDVSVEYAAIILPVIFFSLALLVFFFLVRKIFDKNKLKNLIALIATAIIAFIPSMLHRMTAGIPEKEAMGIFFFFLTLLFFVYGYNSEKNKKTLIFGILTGASTGLLAQVWGGVSFIFIIFGLFGLVSLLLNQVNKRFFILYGSWLLFTIIFALGSPAYSIDRFFMSTLSLFSCLVFLFMFIHLWFREKIEKITKTGGKIPPALVSIIVGTVIAIILAVVFFGPGYITNTLGSVTNSLLHPLGVDRLTLTVAENNQPYFGSWQGEFGLNFFWIFFFSSIFIFFEAMKGLKTKNKAILTGAYFIMLLGLIFSRYSPESTLNGVSSLSQTFYFGAFVLFALTFVYIYLKAYYKDREEFDKFSEFDKNHLFLAIWFVWMAISARGAMRLFMMLAQPAAILVSAVAVKLPQYALKNKEELTRILFWCAAFVVALLLIFSFISFAQQSSREARYTIPSYYNVQWQKAMAWVRENTAEEAVFSHWWDYGYWLQSIGNRATVLDGGNALGYWNHLFGRHVLTGENETEALEFLYAHNVTHLLIDSTEIGKYTAYSSIGSDVDYDRYSWIPTFALDERQTQETKNETTYVYAGGIYLDEDFLWEGKLFPAGRAAIAGVLLNINQETGELKQPDVVIVYNGEQTRVPMRYLYLNNEFYDFGGEEPIQSCLYVIPKIDDSGINNIGAALYLSERGMRALWVHLYLLGEGENFKLVHNEQDIILEELRQSYNLTINDIVFYRGNLLGPIKIWETNYPENIEFKPEYLETRFPDERLYLSRN